MSTFGFIGLGLIGGSLARSIRRNLPGIRLIAYSPDSASLQKALDDHVIDAACTQYDPAFSGCDMIFLCAPVRTNLTYLPFLKEIASPGCILTDVGSVKGAVAEAALSQDLGDRFIGGHPMAGTEKTGYENSSDLLFENAYYFITPTEQSDPSAVERCRSLIESIHALPLILSPEEHDRIVAGVSHLPHIAASSLVNTVQFLDSPEEYMKQAAAGGFRDITRIASSSPEMWEQICLANRDAVLHSLDAYIHVLEQTRTALQENNGPALRMAFSSSRDYRDSLDDTRRGSISRRYALYLDIYDEAGVIATVTTLLAMNGISIRNIGILHNREFEEGVLRIEFYDEESRTLSGELLKKRNYIVRKKV